MKKIFFILLLCLMPLNVWAEYYKQHTVTYTGTVTNYPIKITVYYGPGTDSAGSVYTGSKCRTDFGDIRFMADDGVTSYSYWLESKTNGTSAVYWVKIPSITTSLVMRVYYGDNAKSDISSGANVFQFYENFQNTKPFPYIIDIDSSTMDLPLPTYAAGNQPGFTTNVEVKETTLASQATSGDNILVLTDGSGFRTDGSNAIINGVTYPYAGRTGNTLTGVTGINSTISAGTTVYPYEWRQGVHPSILDMNGTQWQTDTGYRYWLAYTPYPNTNDKFENPCILASNDQVTWVQPVGINNPITTYSGGATHNDDPSLVYDSANNTLKVYYIRNMSIYCITITNTYSISEADMSAYRSGDLSPAVLKVGSTWYMYFDTGDVTMPFVYRTATSPNGPWSGINNTTSTNIGYDLNTEKPWHVDIKYYSWLSHPWVAVYCYNNNVGGLRALALATSDDGITWTGYLNPIAHITNIDGFLYRTSFYIDQGTGLIHLYYSYADQPGVPALNSTKWYIGHTSAVYADVITNASATNATWVRTSGSTGIDGVFHPVKYNQFSNHNYSAELNVVGLTSKFTVAIPNPTSSYELAFKAYDSYPGNATALRVGMVGANGVDIQVGGGASTSTYQVGAGDTTTTGDGTGYAFTPSAISRAAGWYTFRLNMSGGTSGIATVDGNANSLTIGAGKTANMSNFYIRMPGTPGANADRIYLTDIRVRPSLVTEPANSTWGSEVSLGPVNGTCGANNGASFDTLTSGTGGNCATGTVTNFAGSGPWSWYCAGSNGGTDSGTCNASINQYLVTPSPGSNGSMSPSSGVNVPYGSTTSFTITPAACYNINTTGGTCGGSLAGSVYTTNAITGACSVTATFIANGATYTVTPSSGVNATISPTSPVTGIACGSTTNFTITPASKYRAYNSGTCGGSFTGNIFTAGPVTANCTVIGSGRKPTGKKRFSLAWSWSFSGGGSASPAAAPAWDWLDFTLETTLLDMF